MDPEKTSPQYPFQNLSLPLVKRVRDLLAVLTLEAHFSLRGRMRISTFQFFK